jgi:hypothetical protein
MGISLKLSVPPSLSSCHAFIWQDRDRSKIEKLLTNGTTNLKIAHQPKEIGGTCDITIICVKDYQTSLMVGKDGTDVMAPSTTHRPPTRNSQTRSPGVMLLIPGRATPTEKTTADIVSMLWWRMG